MIDTDSPPRLISEPGVSAQPVGTLEQTAKRLHPGQHANRMDLSAFGRGHAIPSSRLAMVPGPAVMAAGWFVEIRCYAASGRGARTGVAVVVSGDDSEEERWE